MIVNTCVWSSTFTEAFIFLPGRHFTLWNKPFKWWIQFLLFSFSLSSSSILDFRNRACGKSGIQIYLSYDLLSQFYDIISELWCDGVIYCDCLHHHHPHLTCQDHDWLWPRLNYFTTMSAPLHCLHPPLFPPLSLIKSHVARWADLLKGAKL